MRKNNLNGPGGVNHQQEEPDRTRVYGHPVAYRSLYGIPSTFSFISQGRASSTVSGGGRVYSSIRAWSGVLALDK